MRVEGLKIWILGVVCVGCLDFSPFITRRLPTWRSQKRDLAAAVTQEIVARKKYVE